MVTKWSLFGNNQPQDMTNGANSNFRRVLSSQAEAGCNGITSRGCYVVTRGGWVWRSLGQECCKKVLCMAEAC